MTLRICILRSVRFLVDRRAHNDTKNEECDFRKQLLLASEMFNFNWADVYWTSITMDPFIKWSLLEQKENTSSTDICTFYWHLFATRGCLLILQFLSFGVTNFKTSE